MAGGMRFDNNDIRALPLHMQEQVGTALVAQMEQKHPVLDSKVMLTGTKVHVRQLCFPTAKAARRYRRLRILVQSGIISDLILQLDGQHVHSFTYTVMEEC